MKLKTGFVLTVLAIAGCASPSTEQIAFEDRQLTLNDVKTQCEEMGTEFTSIRRGFDNISRAMVSLQHRQCRVVEQFNITQQEYADVAGFIHSNRHLNGEEFDAEIDRFDALLPNSDRVRPKIERYQLALRRIMNENEELTADLLGFSAEVSLLVWDEPLVLLPISTKAGTAFDEMRERKSLIELANDMIQLDKATLEQIQAYDNHIKQKVKS
ncbi:hypothetical protein [Vibrio sp. 10N.261.52.F3]|uniref:hypothetical protein n=1 Tax=Vibrio sp. 10N.261.52.F3 TaxID=3229683 RepID=UPI00354ED063